MDAEKKHRKHEGVDVKTTNAVPHSPSSMDSPCNIGTDANQLNAQALMVYDAGKESGADQTNPVEGIAVHGREAKRITTPSNQRIRTCTNFHFLEFQI